MKTKDKIRKLANSVEMASLDMEMMKCESCVGGGGRENWLVNIACVKPDCWISKNASQNITC